MRVLLVDDHSLLRHALAILLDARPGVSVVGEGANGREALELTALLQPEIVVMDVAMPLLNGIEATRQIRSRFPRTRVLILSAYGDANAVGETIAAGASGFIIKRSDIDELVLALQVVSTGNTYFSRELAGQLNLAEITFAAREHGRQSSSTLTSREREVLQLIVEGHTMRSIADVLTISQKTAQGHNSRIMAKLGSRNRADLVRYAIGAALVQLDRSPGPADMAGSEATMLPEWSADTRGRRSATRFSPLKGTT